MFIAIGSPPRAWGRLIVPPVAVRGNRFTPTGVGTAPNGNLYSCVVAVHPHGRGDGVILMCETVNCVRFTPTGVGTAVFVPAAFLFLNGSPPRAWGRRLSVHGGASCPRFTPTGVGTAYLI